MPSMTIVKSNTIESGELQPSGQRPGADSGDPQLRIKKLAPEAEGSLGIWECQPGGWPVLNRQDTEFTYILSGEAVLTDDKTGEQVQIGAGDLVILPKGWSGRWDVKQTVKKIYAVY